MCSLEQAASLWRAAIAALRSSHPAVQQAALHLMGASLGTLLVRRDALAPIRSQMPDSAATAQPAARQRQRAAGAAALPANAAQLRLQSPGGPAEVNSDGDTGALPADGGSGAALAAAAGQLLDAVSDSSGAAAAPGLRLAAAQALAASGPAGQCIAQPGRCFSSAAGGSVLTVAAQVSVRGQKGR